MREPPTHQCQNCDSWFSANYDYCPDCGYATVEDASPTCSLCLTQMEYRGTRGDIQPCYQYYCPVCDRDWAVTHIDIADD